MKTRSASTAAKIVAVALCTLALLTSCMAPGAQETADRLNADRALYGLKALPSNDMLNAKAQAWAERLARENKLYHSNLPDGVTGCWRSIGENVGYGGSIAIVEQAYMNSAGHRANILNKGWNRVGTGVAWNGNKVFTVQVFETAC